MPKICVDFGWDPTGESWPTIMHKLVRLNQLNKSSYKQLLFGTSNKNISYSEKHALTARTFNLSEILRITSWRSDQIKASFIEYLLSFDETLSQSISIHNIIKVSERLRICPACVTEGIHLTFHQCLDFLYCPLHFEPLTDCCPDCNRPLQKYWISLEMNYINEGRYFNCQYCNWGNLSSRIERAKDLHGRKIDIIKQYSQWCSSIVSKTLMYKSKDRHGDRVWQSAPKTFSGIKYLVQFYDSPLWLRKSLLGLEFKKAKLYRHNLKNMSVRCKKPFGKTQISEAPCMNDVRSEFQSLLRERMQIFEMRLLRTNIGKRLKTDIPFLYRGQENVTWRFHKKRSVVATALIILQWAVEDLTDSDKRVELNPFWNQWWSGPAKLFLYSGSKDNWTIKNKALAKELSTVWFDRMLISLYKTLLFHSAGQGERGTVPVFHTPSLVEFMQVCDCSPMFILTEKDSKLTFLEVSVFNDLSTFIDKFDSKYDRLPVGELHTNQTIKQIQSLKKLPCAKFYNNCGWLGYTEYTSKNFQKIK